MLGEELILFRDGAGRPGLVYPRCCHRGTTLYYGKVEERGIRCCYHGWLFDVEGHCLEMPCEPDPTGAQCQRVRQPWYPVEERYGLVFAYLGPPEKKPVLPRYECLEVMGPGEFVEADDSSSAAAASTSRPATGCSISRTWSTRTMCRSCTAPSAARSSSSRWRLPQGEVRVWPPRREGDLDPARPRRQALPPRHRGGRADPARRRQSARGAVRHGRIRSAGPCRSTTRITASTSPAACKEKGELAKFQSRYNGKTWAELTPEEHQKFPGDTEAQVGQGAITFHSEEHLMSSDQGVSMLRILLQKQLDIVARAAIRSAWPSTRRAPT